jgi:hemerythrin
MKTEQDPIRWKLNYNLNIEDIDFQHHFFANLINRTA